MGLRQLFLYRPLAVKAQEVRGGKKSPYFFDFQNKLCIFAADIVIKGWLPYHFPYECNTNFNNR